MAERKHRKEREPRLDVDWPMAVTLFGSVGIGLAAQDVNVGVAAFFVLVAQEMTTAWYMRRRR